MHDLVSSTAFRKDLKLMVKRGCDLALLDEIIIMLRKDVILSGRNRDHVLQGKWKDFHECHIAPDWVLIYRVNGDLLFLARTGTHADLF